MPMAWCGVRGPAKIRFTWLITTPNGACRNMTIARCTKSSFSTVFRPGCPGSRSCASAKGYLKIMEDGPGFSKFMWDFVDGRPKVNNFKTTASVPASTPLSIKMSKELASRGFKFVGPTIVYAFMQATGMVNDHLVTCFCHETCAGKHRIPRLKVK